MSPEAPLITLEWLYMLAGAMFAAFALLSLADRKAKKRFGNAAFWGLMAASLLGGSRIAQLPDGDFINGLIVLGLVGLAGFGFIGRSNPKTTSDKEREAFAEIRGNKLFLPALIIPATALFGTLAYNYTALGESGFFEARRETYILLGIGVLGFCALAVWMLQLEAAGKLRLRYDPSAWKIQHEEGRREVNTLHVPLGTPVRVHMISEDVIHSFYVPAFRIKQDVVPGRTTTTWFEATDPGSYQVFCAEYCGNQHSGMIGQVIVMEPANYEAWLSGSIADAPPQSRPVQRGVEHVRRDVAVTPAPPRSMPRRGSRAPYRPAASSAPAAATGAPRSARRRARAARA